MGQEAQKATNRQCPVEHFAAAVNYTWSALSFGNSPLHSGIKIKAKTQTQADFAPLVWALQIFYQTNISPAWFSTICLGLGVKVLGVENLDTY